MELKLTSMDRAGCESFLASLQTCPEASEYIIDLGDLGHQTPFGFLVCSLALKSFKTSRPDGKFALRGHEAHGYAAHMGFFRAFGADFGNAPGDAPGGERYLPVTLLDVEALREQAKERIEVVQDTVERRAHEISEILLQTDEGPLYDAMGYALTEMMRNVVEHSGAPQIGYCAQYWPSKDLVEVGLVDNGMGIHASLTRGPDFAGISEAQALGLSLLPGVSRNSHRRPDPYDQWANSGYGLYMTSSLCREGGDFFIASGGRALRLRGNEVRPSNLLIGGTAVRLRFRPSELDAIQKTLDRLSAEGAAIAAQMKEAVPSPSIASRLLRRQRAQDT